MDKTRIRKILTNKWFIISFTLVVFFVIGSWKFNNGSSSVKMDLPGSSATIYHIKTSFAEAYLIQGKKLIMIESGLPDKEDLLLKELKNIGFKPEDIALMIITHGHADHAGNAGVFQKRFNTTIVGGANDLDKFRSGKTDLSKCDREGFTAHIFAPGSDLDYTPFTPDIIVKDSVISLDPYGVSGKIVPVSGHTPGSIAVVVEDKYLFCGDLVRADLGQHGTATEHWFQENRAEAKYQLEKLLRENKNIEVVFPGHNGKMLKDDVMKYLKP